MIRQKLLQLQEFQLALHFTPLFLGIPFGIHKGSKKSGINPNESLLELSDVPVKRISHWYFEHHNSKTLLTCSQWKSCLKRMHLHL